MHQSVATINSPEFINLEPLDINPLMSKCDIKVFYIGDNRNGTNISRQTAQQISKTLRGAPIVGYYRDSKQDFTDHGEKIIIDDEGIKFSCQTIPYGFVSPDSKVWFQDFEDFDYDGNSVIHTYLMATGYLWTDQFPESSLPVKQGRPQSMELKPDSVKGEWQHNYENGLDFFIINDAIVQKICILGDDVEPCFEGASITAPEVSSQFTLDKKFNYTLFSMMEDLKNVLKGGQQMTALNENIEVTEKVAENETIIEDGIKAPVTDYEKKKEEDQKKEKEENTEKPKQEQEQTSKEESSPKEQEKEETNVEDQTSKEDTTENKEEEDKKKKASEKYEAVNAELNDLKEKYSQLQSQYQELVKFKNDIDNQKKDALIAEFYMLSDEDKADVLNNKEKYTLDEIKSKLAVICFDKKISFSLEEENKEETVTTYTLNDNNDSNLPDWVKAVKEQEKLN